MLGVLSVLPHHPSPITHTGVVVITDGVIGLPDATVFDSLLVQLRNQTIACSFLQLGSVYQPQRSFGYIPFTDLMNFLATATCGAYMPTLPPVVGVSGPMYAYREILCNICVKYMCGRCISTYVSTQIPASIITTKGDVIQIQ